MSNQNKDALSAQPSPDAAQPALTVWCAPMPESNGKSNFTAILMRKGGDFVDGFTIDISEYPDRVRYEADRVRYLIGELKDRPHILDYDTDKHSGYTAPVSPDAAQGSEHGGEVPQELLQEWTMAAALVEPFDASVRLVVDRAIAWDRQNRASQPVQGVAESVADEKKFEELLEALLEKHEDNVRFKHLPSEIDRELAHKAFGAATEAMRTFFKQSRQSPRAMPEELFDGYAVLNEIDPCKHVSADHVALVLDAVVGLIRKRLSHSSKGDEHVR